MFRSFLFIFGWYPPLAHSLKGWIRKILMLGSRPIDIWFERSISLSDDGFLVKDKIKNISKFKIINLSIGDEFFVRYVPQSRYFQSQELDIKGKNISNEKIEEINSSIKWIKI